MTGGHVDRKPGELGEMLIAEGPHHDLAEELMLFGQFVGAHGCATSAYPTSPSTSSGA